jgi:NAD dependent epimerase/dehydratase
VLVTGADGFIGSHLVEALASRVGSVRALSLYNSFNNRGWLEKHPCLSDIEVVTGDVRDPHICSRICTGVDVVFHLAALIAIPYSYLSPGSYVDTNVKGTLNMCAAALNTGVGKFVCMSTSEVYGTAVYVPIDEKHPLQAQSPYSASKVGADAVAFSFYRSFGLPVVTARPFNTYGPRQSARAVIPSIITQMLSGKSEIQVGNLSPVRDFTYVKDTCEALIRLAECGNAVGETVNIGTGNGISIGDLLNLTGKCANKNLSACLDSARERPSGSEVERLVCDNRKLLSLTGFAPSTPLDEGIRDTIRWFGIEENMSKYKPEIYNV